MALFWSKLYNSYRESPMGKWLEGIKKNNIVKTIIVLFALLLGWFYWFEYRPSQIRSYCARSVSSNPLWTPGVSYETKYERCLHSKGLE